MPGAQPTITNPTPPGGQLIVNEQALPQGSSPGSAPISSSWTFTVSAPDGLRSLSIAGYEAVQNGVFTAGSANFSYGRLDVTAFDPATGQVTVVFTLTGPYQNGPGPTQRYGDLVSFAVVLTEQDGDTASSTLLLQIRDDDAVDARADEATVAAGASVSGSVLANDRGTADGGLVVTALSNATRTTSDTSFDGSGRLEMQGQYGVLTLTDGGEFTYTANSGAPAGAVDRFSYTIRDADGDQDFDWIAVTVTAPSPSAPPPPPAAASDDDNLVGARLFGGNGNDTLTSDNSSEGYLRGDNGNDRLVGGDAFDDLHGNQGDDTLFGGAGGDWVVGGKGDDLLFGDEGDDIVYGNVGDDTCEGGAGADLVRGGQGDDVVRGGAGDDWLSGDRGSDTLTGGAGADTFHSFDGAGLDRVTDFNRAEGDRILLDAGTAYTVRQVDADVVIDMGSGNEVVLVGVSLSSLSGDWIVVG
jgi:Ca2+-binding RTX toxin-like protein